MNDRVERPPQHNTIYCEDCMRTMSRMPDNYVDVVVTSPPYNRKRNDKYNHYEDIIQDYNEWLKKIIDECLRVSKGNVYFNIQKTYYNKADVFEIIGHYKNELFDIVVWTKDNPTPSSGGAITNAYEFILVFGNSWKAETNGVRNVFSTSNTLHFKEHHAVMHTKAAAYLIHNFTKEGQVVYDPFNGMGTTSLACATSGRQYIGSEISQEYVDASLRRIQEHLGMFNTQLAL
jgi:DNA modification methylase